MKVSYRFRIIIEIYAGAASAFVLIKYGALPTGIILPIIAIIFLDILLPDGGDFKK